MTQMLYIDDFRCPNEKGWLIATSFADAINIIDTVKPQVISFDHDLNERHYGKDYSDGQTGYDVALYLIQKDAENPQAGYITDAFVFDCHSQNPAGRERINSVLNSYIRRKNGR